jgi:SAM-dependent methyltransferase
MAKTDPIDISGLDAQTLAKHLANPSGEIGAAVIERLNTTNDPNYRGALARLGVSPGDRVLEIGFGNGHQLRRIVELAEGVRYTGIDISPTMVAQATASNSDLVGNGRAELFAGNSARLPFAAAAFDRALSLNTIYFWVDPVIDLLEVRRVLRPGGRLLIGALAPWSTTERQVFRHGFHFHDASALESLLRAAGFADISIDTVNETVEMHYGPWTRDYFFARAE